MLKKFALRNYKNFKDEIVIDFGNVAGYQFSTDCISDGMIAKLLIYGRNATGKTNFGKAIMDIWSTMFGVSRYVGNEAYLNADSSEDCAAFSYTFSFGDTELVYRYTRLSNHELIDEELIVNGISIFKCDFLNMKYCFDNLKRVDAETANVDRYLKALEKGSETAGDNIELKLPFLRWLINNAVFDDSILIQLLDYISKMIMITVGKEMPYRMRKMSSVFYESLENTEKLRDLEDFLNAMGIECKLILKKLPDDQRELYFAHEKLVPFYENASSGTLALVDLYRILISAGSNPSFIYLDEFDAFYHYEMAENVIKFLKNKYPRCQMIITSHNTNLMTNRLMRPDCMFILSNSGSLTALCNATTRELREGHNLEKMYISGEFEKYE
jgi:hypothetical protein